MKKIVQSLVLVLLLFLQPNINAQTNLLKNSAFTDGLAYWQTNNYGVNIHVPEVIDGKLFLAKPHDLKELCVVKQEHLTLKPETEYKVALEAYSPSKNRPLEVRVESNDGGTIYFYEKFFIDTLKSSYKFGYHQAKFDNNARFVINYGETKTSATIDNITFKPLSDEEGGFYVNTHINGKGKVIVSPDKKSYHKGERVTLEAVAGEDANFICFYNEGFYTRKSKIDVEIESDIDLNASFYTSQKKKENNSRVFVLTDMGNEPDDAQTAVRLLLYANELDIEGVVAVTSFYQRQTVSPQLINERIDAYGKIVGNLQRHDTGWPHPDSLRKIAAPGQPKYGMAEVGSGKQSQGSQLLKKAILKSDPRPLYVCINAGANTLAQALWDLRNELSKEELQNAIDKIRVYDDTGQDDAGAWIAKEFPDLQYYRSRFQVFAFMGHMIGMGSHFQGPKVWAEDPIEANRWSFDQHLQATHHWADSNIRFGHGPLGALYLHRHWAMEGGGTSTWIGHVNKGLYSGEHMTWGGWGGRFEDTLTLNAQSALGVVNKDQKKFEDYYMFMEAEDTWVQGKTKWDLPEEQWKNSDDAPMWRWREAHFNEFKARMDWCVSNYESVNHNPVIVYKGCKIRKIEHINVEAGTDITLDVSDTYDPDGDEIHYNWWVYKESGTFKGNLTLEKEKPSVCSFSIPENITGKEIHLILEIHDENPIAPLYAYKRFVISVE